MNLGKGLQWARLGRPARRSKAHGPARGGPLSPLTGQRATEPVDWSTGRALGKSKACGPARGPLSWAGLAGGLGGPWLGGLGGLWVKIKILLSFEGKGIRTPSLMDP